MLSRDPGTDGAGGSADVQVVRDGGDTIEAVVDADGAGWLVVADSLDDWTATVDGSSAPVVEADHAVGAVAVEGGTHRVVLSYTPSGWHTGLWVSGGALLALLAIGLAGRISPRRRGRGTPREPEPSDRGRSSRPRARSPRPPGP